MVNLLVCDELGNVDVLKVGKGLKVLKEAGDEVQVLADNNLMDEVFVQLALGDFIDILKKLMLVLLSKGALDGVNDEVDADFREHWEGPFLEYELHAQGEMDGFVFLGYLFEEGQCGAYAIQIEFFAASAEELDQEGLQVAGGLVEAVVEDEFDVVDCRNGVVYDVN